MSSSSSLAYGCGLERLWFGGLFTAAEVAAADLLLQLSVGVAGGDHELAAAAPSSSLATTTTTTTTTSSPRSVMSTCCACDGVTVEVEEEEQVEGTGLVDRRARKRFRLLSDLYAATGPVKEPAAAAKKRRRHYYVVDDGVSEDSEPEPAAAAAMRYGDYYN